MKATFKKSERITSRIVIDTIFKESIVLKKYPVILKYGQYEFEDGSPLKAIISVPKRRIKKATARNRIRRQMKEAFRLNKSDLINTLKNNEKSLALFFIYTGKENPDYAIIEEKIKLILKELTIVMRNY